TRYYALWFFFFFFFQAEDGIRDFHVTGVQTCALPIFLAWRRALQDVENVRSQDVTANDRQVAGRIFRGRLFHHVGDAVQAVFHRSEERRVGKECRLRGWWDRDM